MLHPTSQKNHVKALHIDRLQILFEKLLIKLLANIYIYLFALLRRHRAE